MNLFDKCASYTYVRELQAMGIFPYFTPIEETTATEARIGGEWKVMVGSNNYLGLTHHPKVLEATQRATLRYGAGSTGSRLLNGTLDLHYELESRLAAFFKKEAALVFTTGYQASLGVFAPLVGRNDHVFLDRLDHASLVDGARLGLGDVHRYAHGDFDGLSRQLSRVPAESGQTRSDRRRLLDGRQHRRSAASRRGQQGTRRRGARRRSTRTRRTRR